MEVEKNANVYSFHMPMGVSYGEAYDAAFDVLKDILELSQKNVESQRRSVIQKEEDSEEVQKV